MRINVGDGLNLNYYEEGTGTPFVFSAPPGIDTGPWEPHIQLFNGHCRTVMYDGRGAGDSDWSDWYSYKASCEDLAGLLKALDIGQAVIYGGSGGGILALHFALSYPDMTRALVIDGSSSEVNFVAAKNWRRVAEETIKLGRDAADAVTGPASFEGGEFKIERPEPRSKESDPRAKFAFYQGISTLYESPMTPSLGAITCPVLILIGEDDKLAGVGGSVKMSRVISGSELRILPGSGHTVLSSTPEVAQREILSFIQSVE